MLFRCFNVGSTLRAVSVTARQRDLVECEVDLGFGHLVSKVQVVSAPQWLVSHLDLLDRLMLNGSLRLFESLTVVK